MTPTGHETPAPLPTMREALLAGAVDIEHLDVVAEVLKNVPDNARLEDRELVETTLAEQARELSPDALRKFGAQVLERINQDGREPEDKELVEPVNTLLQGTGIATFDIGTPICPEAARRHACENPDPTRQH